MSLVLHQHKQRMWHNLDFTDEIIKFGLVFTGGTALHDVLLSCLLGVGGRQTEINKEVWNKGRTMKIMLSSRRLPAKIPCHMYNL